jgi:hypothetical protein
MSIPNGGPAFPFQCQGLTTAPDIYHGMTLRDWFAGQALQGLCANPGGPFQRNEASGWSIVNCTINSVAELAAEMADAMLAERSKTPCQPN